VTTIQYKTYPSMPEYRHKFRPDDWPADEPYHEVFHLEDTGQWFAAMYDKNGGGQRTSAKDSKEEAEAAIYEHVAFIRKFWDQKVEWMSNGDWTIPDKKNEPRQKVARIGGHHYVIGPQPTQSMIESNRRSGGLGHGGRKFTIRFLDGEVVETINLWAQGEIDPEYKSVLTDNAEFID